MKYIPVAFAAAALAVGLGSSAASAQQDARTAEAIAEEVRRLAESGDLLQAEVLARRGVRLRPGEAAALAALGAILARRGSHDAASEIFAQAVRIDSSDLALRRNLAASQWQAGRLARARASIESVLDEIPHDRGSLLLAGMIAENQGRYEAAARLLRQAGPAARERAASIVAMVRSCYRLGRLEEARRALSRLEAAGPLPADFAAAGTAAFEAGDFGLARGLFVSAARSEHPDRERMLFNAALSSYRLDDFSSARTELEGLLAIEPAHDEAWNLLGWIFEKTGDTERALASLERAIAISPGAERHSLDLGTILAAHRDTWHLAMETVEKALVRHPRSPRLHQLLGVIQIRQQHFLDAAVSYERARALAPESADLHLGLMVALRASGQVERAIETARASIAQFPEDAALRHQLGRIYLECAEWGDSQAGEAGVALLREAIALDPGMADAHYELGSSALRRGDLQAALASLQSAAELAPRSAKAHYALARCFRRMGRAEEASRALQAFREATASDGSARESLHVP